jgi:hypothetical protein
MGGFSLPPLLPIPALSHPPQTIAIITITIKLKNGRLCKSRFKISPQSSQLQIVYLDMPIYMKMLESSLRHTSKEFVQK